MEYFSKIENQILIIDHFKWNYHKEDKDIINLIKKASEKNLIIIHTTKLIKELLFFKDTLIIDPIADEKTIEKQVNNSLTLSTVIFMPPYRTKEILSEIENLLVPTEMFPLK